MHRTLFIRRQESGITYHYMFRSDGPEFWRMQPCAHACTVHVVKHRNWYLLFILLAVTYASPSTSVLTLKLLNSVAMPNCPCIFFYSSMRESGLGTNLHRKAVILIMQCEHPMHHKPTIAKPLDCIHEPIISERLQPIRSLSGLAYL